MYALQAYSILMPQVYGVYIPEPILHLHLQISMMLSRLYSGSISRESMIKRIRYPIGVLFRFSLIFYPAG